eukprot:Hpha_TRINITY_DN31460_c0_g1::TRINITY_DN31460_c0_g1_i1::g.145421::m.145421
MPTPNKFFVGFLPPTAPVQDFTKAMVERVEDLRAVNLFNEKSIGCKFAWLATADEAGLARAAKVAGDNLGGLVPDGLVVRADGVGAEWDETRPEFRQRAYLLLRFYQKQQGQPSEAVLELSQGELDFLLKDPVGGAVVERKFRSILGPAPVEDEDNQRLVWQGLMRELLPELEGVSVRADPKAVVEALRFCDVRRRVTAERARQAAEAKAEPVCKDAEAVEVREPPADPSDVQQARSQ